MSAVPATRAANPLRAGVGLDGRGGQGVRRSPAVGRFFVLVIVLGLAAAIPLYFAAAAIRDVASGVTDAQAIFIALFWLAPNVGDQVTLPSVDGIPGATSRRCSGWPSRSMRSTASAPRAPCRDCCRSRSTATTS